VTHEHTAFWGRYIRLYGRHPDYNILLQMYIYRIVIKFFFTMMNRSSLIFLVFISNDLLLNWCSCIALARFIVGVKGFGLDWHLSRVL